jgi:LysM repeat protein
MVCFDHDNVTYRLPVNPEEIKINTTLAIERYEILKLGQIAVPSHLELREYTFETELPGKWQHYTEIIDAKQEYFKGAGYYLAMFRTWRRNLIPVRFIFGIDENNDEKFTENEGTSVMVLIEDLEVTEKAGEEGDKYISIKLLEYQPYGKKEPDTLVQVYTSTYKRKKALSAPTVNSKSTGYYVVQKGDSLWSIAKKYYGNGSKCNVIYNANKDKIKNPSLISIGWKLKIPTEAEFSKYSAALPTTSKNTNTSSAANYEDGVAGIAALLKNPYSGGTSKAGRTHSSGGGGF